MRSLLEFLSELNRSGRRNLIETIDPEDWEKFHDTWCYFALSGATPDELAAAWTEFTGKHHTAHDVSQKMSRYKQYMLKKTGSIPDVPKFTHYRGQGTKGMKRHVTRRVESPVDTKKLQALLLKHGRNFKILSVEVAKLLNHPDPLTRTQLKGVLDRALEDNPAMHIPKARRGRPTLAHTPKAPALQAVWNSSEHRIAAQQKAWEKFGIKPQHVDALVRKYRNDGFFFRELPDARKYRTHNFTRKELVDDDEFDEAYDEDYEFDEEDEESSEPEDENIDDTSYIPSDESGEEDESDESNDEEEEEEFSTTEKDFIDAMLTASSMPEQLRRIKQLGYDKKTALIMMTNLRSKGVQFPVLPKSDNETAPHENTEEAKEKLKAELRKKFGL